MFFNFFKRFFSFLFSYSVFVIFLKGFFLFFWYYFHQNLFDIKYKLVQILFSIFYFASLLSILFYPFLEILFIKSFDLMNFFFQVSDRFVMETYLFWDLPEETFDSSERIETGSAPVFIGITLSVLYLIDRKSTRLNSSH